MDDDFTVQRDQGERAPTAIEGAVVILPNKAAPRLKRSFDPITNVRPGI
ncbi:hypothetical protein SAMN03159406_04927 [Rhizobium sp. NFR03]|nr:hypothetical protein SAMN03159406_04927 [Rhizobium sp. NFR03]